MTSINCLHRSITGSEALDILLKDGVDGSYLIRPSSTGNDDYSLSVRRGKEVVHIKIQNSGDYYDLFGGEMFANLPQLIEYYSTGEGREHLKEKNGKPIILKKPLNAPKHRAERWFDSSLSALEAEKKLEGIGKGVFLVRESSSKIGEFVLSYFTGQNVIHVFIRKENGSYSVGNGVTPFGCLSGLIDFYRNHNLTVKYANEHYSFKLEKSLLGGIIELSKLDSKIQELDREFTVKNKKKKGFTEEFEYIQQYDNLEKKPMKTGQQADNKTKNRYRNILPYDETRVILKNNNPSLLPSDYINANYIKVSNMLPLVTKIFIATQGCVQNSVADFWAMIWQEKTIFIIMTTELIENGKNKCYLYWPLTTQDALKMVTQQGAMEVKLVKEEQKKDYIIRKLDVFCQGKTRSIFQYHHNCWPDKDTPDPAGVVEFLIQIKNHSELLHLPYDAPWVVHCSAGIGRTGTYILLDALVNHILLTGLDSQINIINLLIMLRKQRAGFVQLDKQYSFVYKALQLFVNSYYKKNERKRLGEEENNLYSNINSMPNYDLYENVWQ